MVVDKDFSIAFGHAYATYTKEMEKERQKKKFKPRNEQSRVRPISRSRGKSRFKSKYSRTENSRTNNVERSSSLSFIRSKNNEAIDELPKQIRTPIRTEKETHQLDTLLKSAPPQTRRSRSRSNHKRSQRHSTTSVKSEQHSPQLPRQSQSPFRIKSRRSRSPSYNSRSRFCYSKSPSFSIARITSNESLQSKIYFHEYQRERRLEEQERKKLIETRKKLDEDRKKLDEMKKQFEKEKAKYYKEQKSNRNYEQY
ncbi:hypothetical protein PVAND_007606 [Polypedilum vanderplanki]|uniref:Uncharacterized protein n=1 Tax=Polypedilum vanderplanki TaxID=319348 RepID=A0A9J6C733_POLVA|nr:hypothetical protein PVAND_007606 [Polypedilum vanderplanki]